ncbi:MAG: FliG C-terminal domain-containing protein [Bdellovibrionales bacterium]
MHCGNYQTKGGPEKIRKEVMAAAKKPKTTQYGVTQALEALSHVDQKTRESIMKNLAVLDPEVARELDEKMLRFEDLVLMNHSGLQSFMKEIEDKKLVLALRGASPDLLKKIFSCFSKRKVQMLGEDIKNLGPQPLSKVEEVRSEIMKEARVFLEAGKMVISTSEEVV